MTEPLTRRQQEIYDYLLSNVDSFPHPPTLDELCSALGLSSKGSLHKQIQALIDAGLVEPMNNRRRGIRLTNEARNEEEQGLPFLGYIAAGSPIEAIEQKEIIQVPDYLRTNRPCYVLQVKGESMIDEGILDGDQIVIEQRDHARNGEIVVALVEGTDATLKRIEQKKDCIILHPANSTMKPMTFATDQVQIQGVLVGQMRRYH
ncbi:transcriptional repressor LexA [Sedimenticola selenatireducens]|jgi:repressor LexA|uniref:LexA repressor n=1 Tax=Sedimenticola selenatireducens TaxID=191960 RepID=A0A557SNM9_9GAMM|nr:transcriptional repressor LexA [Sedimenticola selenatireducens]TVO79006.1 transcriptional repressor LexA [Sedimenticola selenatireducens]TVT67202.1 MAG: transcriptional repressor LexA [Sedimenticola selenatireducens]